MAQYIDDASALLAAQVFEPISVNGADITIDSLSFSQYPIVTVALNESNPEQPCDDSLSVEAMLPTMVVSGTWQYSIYSGTWDVEITNLRLEYLAALDLPAEIFSATENGSFERLPLPGSLSSASYESFDATISPAVIPSSVLNIVASDMVSKAADLIPVGTIDTLLAAEPAPVVVNLTF